MLSTARLVRSFGSLRAVDRVDLELAQGSITSLIGPNGAGKTTLFDLIAGSLAPSAGEISFRGERGRVRRLLPRAHRPDVAAPQARELGEVTGELRECVANGRA